MSDRLNITILGAGAWGCALSCAMVRAGHKATIWARDNELAQEINTSHSNKKYLGSIALEKQISATASLTDSVPNADVILLVTPAQSIAELCRKLLPLLSKEQIVIACAKGIDRKTGKTPAELISEIIPARNTGALSGPSFATDVANGLPTAVTLAFDEMDTARKYAKLMSSENFRIYASDDLVGVELGGALKNVLALAVGAARGMKLGASAEAALIARGFGELQRLAGALGGRAETLSGLSGLGDLVLTASSTQSRNFSYGMAMGKGKSLVGLPLAEGAFSAKIASKLAEENGVDTPIIRAVSEVLAGNTTAHEAVRLLLSRPLKAENE